jgi:hypothetical protein
MTKQPIKRGMADWIVCAIVLGLSAIGFAWWITRPLPETKKECYQRATKEIIARKKAVGETTVKDQQEIEAIAAEMKVKCPN